MTVVSDYTALLSGASWNGAAGKPVFLTYSFETRPAAYLLDGFSATFLNSFQAFSPSAHATAREALRQWADASGVTFFEVPSGQGDLRFGEYNLDLDPELANVAGFAFYPGVMIGNGAAYTFQPGGDIFIQTGLSSFPLYAHEIGHALGLKHSFEDGDTLSPTLDDRAHTVMSYTGPGTTVLGPLDVQAIQHLYGLNSADGTQVASWSWDAVNFVLTQAGGAGSDTITGVGVRDVMDGAGGGDLLMGSDGADTMNGGFGDDTLVSSEGDDLLSGGDGADELVAYEGRDTVLGGNGDDTIFSGYGTVVVDGGAGVDILWIEDYPSVGLNFVFDDQLLTAIERTIVLGTAYRDSVIGGGLSDQLQGYHGDDFVDGRSGDDFLFGQLGADTIVGGTGADQLSGGDGDDLLIAGDGADRLSGGAGVDTADFNGETASINLVINMTRELAGGLSEFMSGIENLFGTGFGDTLAGDAGANEIYGRSGNDVIAGGSGRNLLRGEDGDDLIAGGADFDDIHGNAGADTASGGAGDDWVVGGKDQDLLRGDAGGDVVLGNIGADTCEGGDGNDIVRGGQDNDVLNGGAGADYVSGDRGSDTVTGGAGADDFHSFGDAGLDLVLDFNAAEGDRVRLDPGTSYTAAQAGADTVIALGGGGQVVLAGVTLSSLSAGWIFEG